MLQFVLAFLVVLLTSPALAQSGGTRAPKPAAADSADHDVGDKEHKLPPQM